jgi:hypothetical protein
MREIGNPVVKKNQIVRYWFIKSSFLLVKRKAVNLEI